MRFTTALDTKHLMYRHASKGTFPADSKEPRDKRKEVLGAISLARTSWKSEVTSECWSGRCLLGPAEDNEGSTQGLSLVRKMGQAWEMPALGLRLTQVTWALLSGPSCPRSKVALLLVDQSTLSLTSTSRPQSFEGIALLSQLKQTQK